MAFVSYNSAEFSAGNQNLVIETGVIYIENYWFIYYCNLKGNVRSKKERLLKVFCFSTWSCFEELHLKYIILNTIHIFNNGIAIYMQYYLKCIRTHNQVNTTYLLDYLSGI